jgi:hypothetical protein
MARIRGVSDSDASGSVQALFENQRETYGFVTNTARVYGLRPTIQQGVQALAEGIRASGLIEPELKHLLCVKAASINGCPF